MKNSSNRFFRQNGSELVMKLRDVYGASNVIATDIRETDRSSNVWSI